jgi:uncharacterized protein YcfJ
MSIKPTRYLLAALCLAAPSAWAVEYGTVVSSTPVMTAVPVVQRQCADETVVYPAQRSGAGALIGAIAGAAVGNSIGGGAGRAAATGLGMIAGAAIGDRVEADGSSPTTGPVQRCRDLTLQQNRLVGYDVVYDYQGVRRSVRLAQDPGARIALDVIATPVGALPSAAPPVAGYITPADNAYAPATVVYETLPPRVVYAPVPAYINVSPPPYVVFGGWGGWGGHGYRGGYYGHHRY